MRSSSRQPKLALLLGLAMIVGSFGGWAWLQYSLYAEEEAVLDELRRSGLDVNFERGVFLAQEERDSADEFWEILTEPWREGIDDTFPWLRPLEQVAVAGPVPISEELARRVVALPRVEYVTFARAPGDAVSLPSHEELGIDLDAVRTGALSELTFDEPFPAGRTLLGDERRELQNELRRVWARVESKRYPSYAVSVGMAQWGVTARLYVDGPSRMLTTRWADFAETSIRENGRWRNVGVNDRSALWLSDQDELPYGLGDYQLRPPFASPEFHWSAAPEPTSNELSNAELEYAEALDDGGYVVRFGPFRATAHTPASSQPLEVESTTLLIHPEKNWCVERGERTTADNRRTEWLSDLQNVGSQVVVREQLQRYSDQDEPNSAASAYVYRYGFDWDLDPDPAEPARIRARLGAADLDVRRPIAWYRRAYLVLGPIGAVLVLYAVLRLLGRRALARRRESIAEAP